MRRLLLTLAATLCVAGPLASSDMAAAKDRHGGGGWQQRGGERGDRGGGRWRAEDARGRPEPQRVPQGRWREAPADPRGDPRGDPRAYGRDPRGYGPPDERVIQDHARYRLRPPPRGYAWVRMGNSFALVQESTGQVFDVIPGR